MFTRISYGTLRTRREIFKKAVTREGTRRGVERWERMKRGSGIQDGDEISRGMEILMTEALAKIKPIETNKKKNWREKTQTLGLCPTCFNSHRNTRSSRMNSIVPSCTGIVYGPRPSSFPPSDTLLLSPLPNLHSATVLIQELPHRGNHDRFWHRLNEPYPSFSVRSLWWSPADLSEPIRNTTHTRLGRLQAHLDATFYWTPLGLVH